MDSIQNTTKFCPQLDSKLKQLFKDKLKDKCMELCSEECLKEEYSFRLTESNSMSGIDHWLRQREDQRLYSKLIEWDSSEPMFAYTEEPVTTFSDYLVNCGGLMGLWFGTSA